MMAQDLPQLPLPVMEEVLTNYLDALASFTPDLADSKVHCEELRERKDLLEYIQDRSQKTQNWAYDWWLSEMYLSVGLPLPINSNPGMVFPRLNLTKGKEISGMVTFATRFTLGLIEFKKALETGSLPQDTQGNSPLCMKQYLRLLNFYRQPGVTEDRHLDGNSGVAKEEELVIVLRGGNIFKMRVKEGGEWVSGERIYGMLLGIAQASIERSEDVYLLTSEDRRVWGGLYKELAQEDAQNKQNLSDIASSLFIICIDEPSEQYSESHSFTRVLTGSTDGGSNRWFDKTLQIVVSPDGLTGLCYEHSPAEGVAVVNTLCKILQSGEDELLKPFENQEGLIAVEPMQWNLSSKMRDAIAQARTRLQKAIEDLDASIFVFEDFGKDVIKGLKCSPDGFTQLALQLTYFRLNECLCATYESASTRRFVAGRVDCIRSSHPEALAWVKTMKDPSASKDSQREALRKAISKQSTLIRQNISGHGLDIPLLGFKKASEEISGKEGGMTPPRLFSSPEYAKSNEFLLSTSQIPIQIPGAFMGYGPVVPNGWGAAYNIRTKDILIVISCLKSGSTFTCNEFAEAFKASLTEMREVLQ